jgi:creatinine amidohydrolase
MRAELLSTTAITDYAHLTALIPFGAFEQHGPRLPLATDSMIATALTERVESQSPHEVLLFPTLWVGDSLEHEGFPGTLSLKATTLMTMLEELFTWLEKAGFKKALVYNAHGGNKHVAALVCEEFSRQHNLKVKSMYAYTPTTRKLAKDLFGVSETHGGSTEASLLAALRPDLNLKDGSWPHTQEKSSALLPLTLVSEISKTGILEQSDKVVLSIEKGVQLASHMVAELRETLSLFV